MSIDWGQESRVVCADCAKLTLTGHSENGMAVFDLYGGAFFHCPHVERACIEFNRVEQKRTRREHRTLVLILALLACSLTFYLGAWCAGL